MKKKFLCIMTALLLIATSSTSVFAATKTGTASASGLVISGTVIRGTNNGTAYTKNYSGSKCAYLEVALTGKYVLNGKTYSADAGSTYSINSSQTNTLLFAAPASGTVSSATSKHWGRLSTASASTAYFSQTLN